NHQRISLVREPSFFAVRYKAGRDSRDAKFSRTAFQLLHEESENIGFIPNYALQIYQTTPLTASTKDINTGQLQIVAAVKSLNKETPVEYAAVAYRRNNASTGKSIEELMFVTREFI